MPSSRPTLQIRNKAIERALEKAVSDNRVSSAEAEQIRQWWQRRPAALDTLISGFLPRLAPRLQPYRRQEHSSPE